MSSPRAAQKMKRTPLGDLPLDWEVKKLKDITTQMVNGGTPSRKVEEYWQGDIPWITGADFLNQKIGQVRRYITRQAVQESSTNIIPQGALLLVTRTGVGKMAIAPYDLAISQDITGIFPQEDLTTSRFLFWTLAHYSKRLAAGNQGTSINGVLRTDLENFILPLPPCGEQNRIDAILSSIEDAIDKTQAVIAQTEVLKKGLMQQLFTRGVLPDGRLRPSREKVPELYNKSPLGWNPKEWKVVRLDEADVSIIDGDRGVQYPHAHEYFKEGPCLFLSAANVTSDGFKFNITQFISREKDESLGTGKLTPRDIVITTRGTVGNIAYFGDNLPFSDIRINSGMVILRANNKKINATFLYHLLRNYLFDREYKRVISGSAQPQLPIKDLKDFHLIIPTLNEQERIFAQVNAIDRYLFNDKQYLIQLQNVQHCLNHILLIGRVRVV